ncbi:cathelicidin-1-like isoform X2 [Notamacropus eugenii]|uniref:cathelicidin-1-like isoform X2 n=1 Tax=Notamacropus eugenii TaxID=9315 RepID=UPI003B678F50
MRGSTMQVVLLVLGLLSLMTPLACAQDQAYQDVVNRFIREYNAKSESESLFRLSVLTLPPQESNDPTAPQLLQFTIRETVCSKTEHRNPEECDFKKNGLVEECIGTVDLYSSNPSVDISCDGNKDPAALRPLTFTIRETVCPRTENCNPDERDFSENEDSNFITRNYD